MNFWLSAYAAGVTLGLIASAVIVDMLHVKFDQKARLLETYRRRCVDDAYVKGFNEGVNAKRMVDEVLKLQENRVPHEGFLQ